MFHQPMSFNSPADKVSVFLCIDGKLDVSKIEVSEKSGRRWSIAGNLAMAMEMKFTYIKDLVPSMPRVNVQFIVLDVGPPRRTKSGDEVRTIRVADKTGSVNVAVWNELGSYLRGGDICRLMNGFTSLHHISLCLTCGRFSELLKVGEFCMTFSEFPFMSTPNHEFAKAPIEQANARKRPSAANGRNTEVVDISE